MKFRSPKQYSFLPALFVFFYTFFSVNLFAADSSAKNNNLWKNVGDGTQITKQIMAKSSLPPLQVRQVEMDELSFQSFVGEIVDNSELLFSAKTTIQPNKKIITLPLPDGSDIEVSINPSKVMSDALANQFPDIKMWDVKGISEDITGTIDFTHKGFHGLLFMPDGDRVFIEPDFEHANLNQHGFSSNSRYISFSNKKNKKHFDKEFNCGVHDDYSHLNFATKGELLARPSSDLITYRLAVAATGEYSQFHGGTVASALSAIATTINRVNLIYRRDFSIQFELVDEQSDIIYLNANTDPYTNSDVFQLIQENNLNLSNIGALSKSLYDVGHVFGEGNVGGLAIVGGVCDNAGKAFGATGISSPVGDAFDLDFVAHELGHQLGGSHTFNSACNDGSERTGLTAVEPGSGTTIMAYPGICQANNIQNNVDPQFHIVSIDQIRSVTRSGGGSSCGVRISTTNENPTANAGQDTIVPARTPLVFVAEGADADGDALTYSWEQTDTGTVSNVNVDTGDNALFRSRPLTSENIRYIPRLSDLFSSTTSDGELLPVTNRDINMAVTIRDDKGGLQADLMKMQVFDTGTSFSVTSHTNAQSFGREESTEVRWNVAGTNTSPISCANVDIGLATVDGQGLDIVTTANDGRETIIIPNNAPVMNNARFIVSCNSSNFLNISKGVITILDQVGGGTTTSTGGGGSFNIFMMVCGFVLIYIRKIRFNFKRKSKHHIKLLRACVLILPFLTFVQACSSPSNNSNEIEKIDKSMPKEFGNRFSIEKIKKEREAFYIKKRSELKKLSPDAEVFKALQSNNKHYLAVSAGKGTPFSIPGLVQSQTQTITCNTKSVEGVGGDVLYGQNHLFYRQEMLSYMKEFNKLMSLYCK